MLELSRSLPQVLQQMNLGERLREGRIMDLWPEVVGPTVAERSRPVKCHDGVLTVAVSSSVWLQQLTMMRQEIVRLFAERIGKGAITEIDFTSRGWSEWHEDPILPVLKPRTLAKLSLGATLPDRQQQHLEAAVREIPDEGLRERAARMIAKAQLRQEALKAKGWKPCGQCGELHDRGKPLCIVCETAVNTTLGGYTPEGRTETTDGQSQVPPP
jgi:predicted nucleic acid-binding Zn ribbon protein